MYKFLFSPFSQRSHPGSADEADNITDEELEGEGLNCYSEIKGFDASGRR